MTKQSSLSTTFWTLAAAAAVAILFFGIHQSSGAHYSEKNETDSTSCQEDSNVDESGEVRDSSEETIMTASPRETSAEEMPIEVSDTTPKTTESPPSTPVRPATAKGKKWRDRLSAKKQLKLKQHQKNRDSSLRSE